MTEIEEGTDFESVFKSRFGQNRASTEARMKKERIANLTPRQRQARAKRPPKKQINFRASEETRALLYAIADHLGKSVTDTIALMVQEYAESLPDLNRSKANGRLHP